MIKTKGWYIRQNPLFSPLPERELEILEQVSESHDYRRRTQIWSPGGPANTIYLVRSGIIKIYRVCDDARELTLHFLTKDHLFGELSIVSPTPHDSAAEAYEDTSLLTIPKDEFVRVMMRNASLAVEMMKLVGDRRRQLENRVESLLFRSAHSRLASLFLELSGPFGVRDGRGVIINLKLTHKEIASLIGATRETVSFAILDMRRDNLVVTEGKRVIILDAVGLKKLRDD